MYRLIASDLDGTLLGPDGEPTKDLADAVGKLQRKGIHFVAASGRMYTTQKEIAQKVCVSYSVVAYNGAVTVCEDGTVTERRIDTETMRGIIRYCYVRGYYVQCYHDAVIYTKEDSPLLRSDPDSRAVKIQFGNLLEKELRSSPKIVIVPGSENVPAVMSDIKSMYPKLYVTQSGPQVVEIMPNGVDKAKALESICERLGIESDEVIAFGDGMNDIPMIRWAGLGVAVGNAPDAVKKAATVVATKNGPDGILEVLRGVFPDILK